MKVNEIFIVQISGEIFSYVLEYSRLECGTVDWLCSVHSLKDYIGRVDLTFTDSIEAMNLFQHMAVQRAYELRQFLDYKEVFCEKK